MIRLLVAFQLLTVFVHARPEQEWGRSTTDLEFLRQRWSKTSTSASSFELSSAIRLSDQPSSSLSIRGGGEEIASLPSKSTVQLRSDNVIISSNDSASLTTRRYLTGNRNVEHLSAAAFVVSSAVFFAGSHLETVWTAIRPRVGNWIRHHRLSRINRTRYQPERRQHLHKLVLGLAIGTFMCPTLTLLGGVSALAARTILLEIRQKDQDWMNSNGMF
jgi:hypothetical protein